MLKEYYCDGDIYKVGNRSCSYGCDDGACKPAPASSETKKPLKSSGSRSSSGGSSFPTTSIVVEPEPYCGDDVCTAATENCTSCEVDCGACPLPEVAVDDMSVANEGNADSLESSLAKEEYSDNELTGMVTDDSSQDLHPHSILAIIIMISAAAGMVVVMRKSLFF